MKHAVVLNFRPMYNLVNSLLMGINVSIPFSPLVSLFGKFFAPLSSLKPLQFFCFVYSS